MMPEYVERLLPTSDLNPVDFYFANAMTKIKRQWRWRTFLV